MLRGWGRGYMQRQTANHTHSHTYVHPSSPSDADMGAFLHKDLDLFWHAVPGQCWCLTYEQHLAEKGILQLLRHLLEDRACGHRAKACGWE